MRSAGEAEDAARAGAEALVVRGAVSGVDGATRLPVLLCAETVSLDGAVSAGASAVLVPAEGLDEDGRHEAVVAAVDDAGLEAVVEVRDEDELALALERLDPEIFLLSGARAGDGDSLEVVLGLLGDVPAGKLAVAELDVHDRDDVEELERAGVDGVIVPAGSVAELLSATGPAV